MAFAAAKDSGSALHGERLIDESPGEPNLLNGIRKLLKVHRLDDVALHAQSVALDEIALVTGCGDDYDRDLCGRRVFFKAPKHVQAVNLWEPEIEQDKRWSVGFPS